MATYDMCGLSIKVYLTISGMYRAYVSKKSYQQAWGSTKEEAVRNLALKYDLPFDLEEMGFI